MVSFHEGLKDFTYSYSLLGPTQGAQHECPPTGAMTQPYMFCWIYHSFKGNQIVLNEAHVGKGEQLRAGKPRKEDDIEVILIT